MRLTVWVQVCESPSSIEYPAEIDKQNPYEIFAYQVVSEIVAKKIVSDEELLDLFESKVTEHADVLEFERMLEIVANIKREINTKPLVMDKAQSQKVQGPRWIP